MKNKVLIVLLISIPIVIGAYFLVQQYLIPGGMVGEETENGENREESDMSGQKMYVNTKYYYQISYPEEWLGGETNSNTDYATFSKEAKSAEGQMGSFLIIQVFDRNGLTVQEWWSKRDKNDGAAYSYQGQEDINGISMRKYKEEGGLESAYAVFEKDEHIFLISRIGFNDEIFNEFLNSFEILELSENWKVYRKEEIGVEFSYPPELLYFEEEQATESMRIDTNLDISAKFFDERDSAIFQFYVYNNDEGLSLDDWIKQDNSNSDDFELVEIGGYIVRYYPISAMGLRRNSYVMQYENKVLFFNSVPSFSEIPHIINSFNQ